MNVADVMTRGVISLSPDDSLQKAAKQMMQYQVSGFPVMDRGKLVGIIPEGDLRQRAALRIAAENIPGVKQVRDDLI